MEKLTLEPEKQDMEDRILMTEYSDEMQKSYLDYSMSVITSRAIPDVRDGLKPVQRRVLYDMNELHLGHDKPHRKSARIVGDTMGKYHPHGDSSIYETLVVMSQDFKKGVSMVDGHGNFGSIEGDGAAAMRYTEARLKKFTEDVFLKDLDKTVDYQPNYDESEKEPVVLPVKVPNLLVNGADGIAVGMATSIPPHNLREVIDLVLAYIDNPGMTVAEMMQILPGPDFPTGGVICNQSELQQIYETGVGKIRVRGKVAVERGRRKIDKDRIVITEIPYTMIGAGINKFLVQVAELVEAKKIPDITDISNQSSKDGIRIVFEIRKDADADKIINLLYKKTKLEDTFGVNMLAIADGRPETLSLDGILTHFMNFQYETNTRKYTALFQKETERKEILSGLVQACIHIDEIIAILKKSKTQKDAKRMLMEQFSMTERQAVAVLDMKLSRLIGLELEALQKELKECNKKLDQYEAILKSSAKMNQAIKKDLMQIRDEFGTDRKTLIHEAKKIEIIEEAVVQDVVFLMDRFGYCKSVDKNTFERNKETIVQENRQIIPTTTADKVLFFTDTGVMHTVKMADVPLTKLRDKGVPLENICKYDGSKEEIRFVTALEAAAGKQLLFITRQAMVKRVSHEQFVTTSKTISATKLADGDSVVRILLTDGSDELLLSTEKKSALRFPVSEVPVQKRASVGVKGMRLANNDRIEAALSSEEAGGLPDGDARRSVKTSKRCGRCTKVDK